MSTEYAAMTGAELLVRELITAGVETVFCITGAGNLAIVDAIVRTRRIKLVYSHHEQAAVMEAQGYSRVSGKMGVALVTTGGGTSNALTGVLSAYLDSVPVLIISGNESSFHCENSHNLRAYGVQGFDSVAVFKPVTKASQRIRATSQIGKVVREAIDLAKSDRFGPTHIDFPMDLQRKIVGVQVSSDSHYRQTMHTTEAANIFLEKLEHEIVTANQPILYIGNGVRNAPNIDVLKQIIQKYKLPFSLSWSALDLFSDLSSLNMGPIGIYGNRAANIILQKADLLLTIGTRLAIPQIGYDKSDFGRKAVKFIVDIDPKECAKFSDLPWNVLNSSAEQFIDNLSTLVSKLNLAEKNWADWNKNCNQIQSTFPRLQQIGPKPEGDFVHSADVMAYLNDNLPEKAIIVTDVGAALLTGHSILQPKGAQRIFTSQGLGEMGFGLPGAIGAHFASVDSALICLNTDGAIMFNLQELQLVKEHEIPLKLFIFNNAGYSMIKISQQNLFDSRFSGSGVETGISFPNFEDLANLFSFQYLKITSLEDQKGNLKIALDSKKPELIEIVMSPEQKYLPRLATSKLDDGSLISPPLEDLDPKIELRLLESALGYSAHENSYLMRGIPRA